MQIDQKTLEKIAHLSRLELDSLDTESLKKDMEEILTWVQKLDELDTANVEPLINMSYEVNAFREDDAHNPVTKEQALKNAPKKDDDYFRVPKVLK